MVETITLTKESFGKVLADVETLVCDMELLTNKTVQKRLAEIKQDPSIGKSEKELDDYLKKRGVQVG